MISIYLEARMSSQKKRYDLGGAGDKWNIGITIINTDGNSRYYYIDFCTDQVQKAKQVVLEQVQRVWKRYKNTAKLQVTVLAAPYIAPSINNAGLDGDRMLRLRHKFTTGKSILRIKNPAIPFVVGYGPEQARLLTE
jgi:hypothetical protein